MRISKRIRHEAKQLFRLSYVDGLFDEGRAQHLVKKFVQSKPRGCLAVLTEFQRLVKLAQAERTVKVESAIPLNPDDSAKVKTKLEKEYGPGLTISFLHNPALIGGMRITAGSDVYDGSVQGRLAALKERFS